MKKLKSIIYDVVMILVNAVAIIMLLVIIQLCAENARLRGAYYSDRAQHEAFLRTIGRGVDTAYVCKEKVE